MKALLPYIGGALLGGCVLAMQYGFAMAGEPRMHWFYCEVLHLCSA